METLTYEWRRAKTIRTTWITGAFVTVVVAAFGFLTALAVTDMEGNRLTMPATNLTEQALTANPIAIVLVSSLGAMAFGHEYRYGTIRLTLTAFPKRGPVFWAKLAMTLIIAAVAVAVAVVVVYAGLSSTQGAVADPDQLSVAGLAWHSLVFTITYAVLAFALTVITRNHPLGIIGPLLLFMLELIFIPVIAGRFDWVDNVFPIAAMGRWFTGESLLTGAGVWAAWMVGLLAIGFLLLKRRDA